jgi:FAD/FMN-containing dehydrogenase
VPAADPLVEQLAAVVGPADVLLDPDLRAGYETDWTGRYGGRARAVVRPGSAAEVAAVLATCTRAGATVVPQGGNTGLVGGSVPRGGEIVLSTRRLDDVDLDAGQGQAVVGAGVVLEHLQGLARGRGWDVGVDLAARGSCTIGGMVATNAGGQHVLRYGTTAEQVLGVEAVLADGTVVGRVPALRKDNTGYRWPGILAGSEGTLAVVTRVHLRLVPRCPERAVALVGLADLEAALALVSRLRRALPDLHALEVMLADGLALVREHTGLPAPLPAPSRVVLLVEVAGPAGAVDRLVAELGAALGDAPEVESSAVATDAAGTRRLWRYREAHTEAINAAGIPHKLDVSLPFARLDEFARRVVPTVAAVAPGARTVLFGHLGDGNLHVNVLGPAPDDATVDDAVLDLVVELGGSISAEHGIGVAKRDALARSRPAAELGAQRAIKRALDPADVLNPGVLFAR